MTLASSPPCRACGGHMMLPLGPSFSAPLSTAGWPRTEAEAQRMHSLPIRLMRCLGCGHVHNAAFDANLVPKHVSLRMFNRGAVWAEVVANRAKDVALRAPNGATVLDIGCGDGGFLELLRQQRPDLRLIGVDPAALPCAGISIEQRPFSPTDVERFRPDVIVLRHVIEHLDSPRRMLEELCIRAAMHALSPMLYVEVPSFDPAIQTGRIADVLYEHCSHFTQDSFAAMWRTLPLSVVEQNMSPDGEVVWAHVQLDQGATLRYRMDEVRRYAVWGANQIKEIHAQLDGERASGHRVVVWGGTGKSAAFLNRVQWSPVVVVDSDPRKVGGWVPGTGHPICSPADLEDGLSTVVVVPSRWRLPDIAQEIQRRPIALSGLLVEAEGRLESVPFSRHS